MAKVTRNGSGVKRTRGSGKVNKAQQKTAGEKLTQAKRKDGGFGGTTRAQLERPPAELPRSGWKDTDAFKDAARNARARPGNDFGALPDRPTIRPLYGLPVPVPIELDVKDKDVEKWVKDKLGDRHVSLAEVKELVRIAQDNGSISKQEKKDLKRIIDNASQFFDIDALRELQKFVKDEAPVDRPVIRPLYGIAVPVPLPVEMQDRDLKAALRPILRDASISDAEVKTLIDTAKSNGGISRRERADLTRLYNEAKELFAAEAHERLGLFLGLGDIPRVVPLYGIPVPVPLPADLQNQHLADALEPMLRDRKISDSEVKDLIKIASEGGLSATERGDLQRLVNEAPGFFEPKALARLSEFLGPRPPIRPLYGLPVPVPIDVDVKDRGLKEALKPILRDRTISVDEVKLLINTAERDGRGISKTERADLTRLLKEIPESFTPDALAHLEAFLGAGDGNVSDARKQQIMSAFNRANLAGTLNWQASLPMGTRMVEVPLMQERHPDGFTYTAMIPVGALAPNAPTTDPNKVNDVWIRRTGGIAGMTHYVQLTIPTRDV